MPSLRSLLHAAARLAGAAALSALALAATACEETPDPKTPAQKIDPAEQARIEQGKKLIAEAETELADKQYDKARGMLKKAAELAVESQRFQVEEMLEKLDKRQAKLWANEVSEDLKSKNCEGAIKQLQEPIKKMGDSEAFTRELRKLVGGDVTSCLQAEVEAKIHAGDIPGARKIAAAEHTKTVLGQAMTAKLASEVESEVLEALRGRVEGDLKARKWAQASEKIEAAAKKGEATDDQVEELLEPLRDGVKPEIASLASRGVGQKDAAATLRQVDALVKMARWTPVEDGTAALQGTKALPEELAKKRVALAIWAEAQRLGMASAGRPEARFAHGKIAVTPPAQGDAPSKRDVPHGAQVWIVGVGKGKALITTNDPAGQKLADVLEKAAGWAPTDRLAKEKTLDWLVPDEQLKGERVWGPLRQGDANWELGVVMEVHGRDFTVQRLADGQNVKLPRGKLRSGRLSPGTRVITFCIAKDQPAVVVEVPLAGRSAKLKCDGGQEKEEDLASLRSKPELLPATR